VNVKLNGRAAASQRNIHALFLASALFSGLIMFAVRHASADSNDPCPFGNGLDPIARCTETLLSPKLLPEDKPYALWQRGWSLYDASKYAEALADFDSAIDLIPNDTTDAAQNLHPVGSAERETHDQGWDLVYRYGDFFAGRATTLMWLGRFDEAVDAASNAEATFHSKQLKAYAQDLLAEIRQRMGNVAEAEQLYRQAIDLDATSAKPLYDLALLKLTTGQRDGIGPVLEEAITREPYFREPALLLVALKLPSPERKEELLHRNDHLAVTGWDDAIAEYLAGRIDLTALMKRPEETDDEADRYRLFQIHFFLGVASMAKADAIGHFESAMATVAVHAVEYRASQAMLANLTKN
jgi:tetratricopeptide (TPR) repeat protein